MKKSCRFLLPAIQCTIRHNEVVDGVRLLVINLSKLSATMLIFPACAEFGACTYPPLCFLCLGFIDHEIALSRQERSLLSFKLLKNSDGVAALDLQVFSMSFLSVSFLLIKFANVFAISSSLNPCPSSLVSVYVSGLTSPECSTFLFPIFVNYIFSPKLYRSFSFNLSLCLNSAGGSSRPCFSLISWISCISSLPRNSS